MTPPEKRPFVPALRSLLEDEGRSDHPTSERLIDYRSGWLSPEESSQIATHVRTCEECSELLVDLEAFEELEAAPMAESEPDREAQAAWQRLRTQITEPKEQRPMHLLPSPSLTPSSAESYGEYRSVSLRRNMRLAYALAASLACVAVGLAFWGNGLSHQVKQLNAPKTDLTVVDLFADAERGQSATATMDGDGLVFLVHPPSEEGGAEPPPEYRAEIRKVGEKGSFLSIAGLHPGDGGALTFSLNRSSVPPGDYQIELSMQDGKELRAVGVYRFSVALGKPPT